MSNAELRKLNERQNLESQYKKQNSMIKKASVIVGATAATLGSINMIKNTAPQLIDFGKKVVKRMLFIKRRINYGIIEYCCT